MEQNLINAADALDPRAIAAKLADQHVADAAEFLNEEPLAAAASVPSKAA